MLNDVYGNMYVRRCPYCQDTELQIKVGFTKAGSQRFECKLCHRRYTPKPKRMYRDEMRRQAVTLLMA